MSNRNHRTRRVSVRQLEILWEFLNSHKDVAMAHNRSLQAKDNSCRRWKEIAYTLNAIGDGVHKDWRGWSKYWVDFKAKLKRRVAAVHAQTQSKEGVPTEQPLSTIENKYLQVLGEDFGRGLPVRVDPFKQPSGSGNACSMGVKEQDPPVSQSQAYLLHSVPVHFLSSAVDFKTSPPNKSHTPPPCSPPPSTAPVATAATAPATVRQQLRRRRRKPDPPMSQEAARRALVRSSRIRAKAALRTSAALERIAQNTENIRDSVRIMQR